jgi:glycosyltransferase involved in cell wall biosynthesis
MKTCDLSIIVPLLNEEECVKTLYKSIVDALGSLKLHYEIIFVDDGSVDRTFAIAKEIANNDKRLKVVKFRRNYGQTAAMAAGIEHASGKILITMDGDLQNDPADIPKFIDKIGENYDIVCGWRYNRRDKLVTRKLPSKAANWIIGKITGVPIKDNGCSLKAYRAELIKSVPLYSDMHRFIPAMTSLAGTKIAEIKVNHHPRQFGKSKYGLSRIYKVLVDLLSIKTILSFAMRPLRLFASTGLLFLFIGMMTIFFSMDGIFSAHLQVDFMIASGGLLFIILSFFLIIIGLACELGTKTGEFKDLSNLKRRIE